MTATVNPMRVVVRERAVQGKKKKKMSKQNNAARQLGDAAATVSQLACSNLELN